MSLSTHVLDQVRGCPAVGVQVVVDVFENGDWKTIAADATNDDGRIRFADAFPAGQYRITFDTGAWWSAQGVAGFYPWVPIVFEIGDAARHHHVPLLLSPFGYSTYRGS